MMSKVSDEAITKRARSVLSGPFLTLAVAVSFAVGSLSYMSGSGPEWIALKSSISLFTIGIMGWLVSAFASQNDDQVVEQAERSSPDVALPEAGLADAAAAETSPNRSSER